MTSFSQTIISERFGWEEAGMYHEGDATALPPKGNRVLLRSRKCTYVYYFTRRWYDRERGKTVDDRVSVGKLCPDGETMWPNDRWYEISAGASGAAPAPREVAKYRNVGVYLGIRAACERIGLLGAMRAALPGQWDRLLALVTYVIDDRQACAQLFTGWCYHNYCGFARPFSDSTVSGLYAELAELDWGRGDLMERFHEEYLRAVPHEGGLAVALDGTNGPDRPGGNAYRAYGHPKSGKKGVPQVNQALVVDEMTGIPLHAEDFCGSLLDMTETPATVERIRTLGFERLLFAVDSGYATRDCAGAFTERGYEFTVMAPSHYDACKDAMARKSREVRKESCYIPDEDCYGCATGGVECLGGTYDVHLFFDASRAKDEVDAIHQKAKALLALANERVRYTDKSGDSFAPCVTVTKVPKDPETGKTYRAEPDSAHFQAEIDGAGYFAVVSSPGHTSGQVLRTQRLRERAEKSLGRYNSSFGMMATGTQGTNTYVGKTFMGFLALVACESFRWYTRELSKGHQTCALQLSELRKVQCYRDSGGAGRLATGLTKTQKDIFACLGMDEAAVVEQVAQLSL